MNFLILSGQDRYRNFIHSLMNSNQPDGVHIINANIAVPLRDNSNSSDRERSRESSQTRSNTTTQPTTSTQTRSTTRPFLTSTTLPSTSIRHGRQIPSNFLSSFDRFLPCNSHHIRDNNNQQQQQQTSQNQSANSTPRREPTRVNVQSANVREGTSTTSVPPTATSVPQTVEDELNRRFTLFGIELSLSDLNNLTAGFYVAQRDELRTFIRQRFLTTGTEFTEDVVNQSVMKMIEAMGRYLERLDQFPQNDFYARRSVENYLLQSMPQLINTIFEENLTEFGTTFENQLSQFCQKFYMVLIACIGSQNAEKYLKETASMVMTGNLINLSGLIQKYIDERKSYDFNQIQTFLIAKPKIENERMEVDEDDAQHNDSNIQNDDLQSDPLPIIRDNLPWHSHFPSNWLSIITRDIAKQQKQVRST
jgi:large proline-rich protein BAG6